MLDATGGGNDAAPAKDRGVRWSRYNVLVRSDEQGGLLYNILSNSFAELDAELWVEAVKAQEDPSGFDLTRWPDVTVQLMAMKALVSQAEEEDRLNLLNLVRLGRNFDSSHLSLTIAPTQACNFRCTYCYEADHDPVYMDDRTEGGVVAFVRRFGQLRHVGVTWYGGEPLLALLRIRTLTAAIRETGIPYGAGLITNGYLLTEPVVGELEELGIRQVQVTLDGPREVHDRRRPLAGGRGTFDRILENLERLAAGWNGRIAVRVNVDRTNAGEYEVVRALLRERLPAGRVTVYPGIVTPGGSAGCGDAACTLDPQEEAAFYLSQHRVHGNRELPLYPKLVGSGLVHGSCMAHTRLSFVVGPTGALYKCYHDLGVPGRQVGTVFGDEEWNEPLLARYMVGTDPFQDPACRACVYLPLCGGGCAHFRMRSHYEGAGVSTCTRFKAALPEFLALHYERRKEPRPATAPERATPS